MTSHTTEAFRKRFANLPETVQKAARKNYQLWKINPHHPSLEFKKVHNQKLIYSVRISREWRAVGIRHGNAIAWFWIGSHADYDQLLKQQ